MLRSSRIRWVIAVSIFSFYSHVTAAEAEDEPNREIEIFLKNQLSNGSLREELPGRRTSAEQETLIEGLAGQGDTRGRSVGFQPNQNAKVPDYMVSKAFQKGAPWLMWEAALGHNPSGQAKTLHYFITKAPWFRKMVQQGKAGQFLEKNFDPVLGHLLWKVGCDAGFYADPFVRQAADGRLMILSDDNSRLTQAWSMLAAYAVYTAVRYGSELFFKRVMPPLGERTWTRMTGRELFFNRVMQEGGGVVLQPKRLSDKWGRIMGWFHEYPGSHFGDQPVLVDLVGQWVDITASTYLSWSAFDVAMMWGQTGEINFYPYRPQNMSMFMGLTLGGYFGGIWGYKGSELLINSVLLPAAHQAVAKSRVLLQQRAVAGLDGLRREAGLEAFENGLGRRFQTFEDYLRFRNKLGRRGGYLGFILLGGYLAGAASDAFQRLANWQSADREDEKYHTASQPTPGYEEMPDPAKEEEELLKKGWSEQTKEQSQLYDQKSLDSLLDTLAKAVERDGEKIAGAIADQQLAYIVARDAAEIYAATDLLQVSQPVAAEAVLQRTAREIAQAHRVSPQEAAKKIRQDLTRPLDNDQILQLADSYKGPVVRRAWQEVFPLAFYLIYGDVLLRKAQLFKAVDAVSWSGSAADSLARLKRFTGGLFEGTLLLPPAEVQANEALVEQGYERLREKCLKARVPQPEATAFAVLKLRLKLLIEDHFGLAYRQQFMDGIKRMVKDDQLRHLTEERLGQVLAVETGRG